MRKRDRKELAEYIRWVANEMELRDWSFTLATEPCADDCDGEIKCIYGRKYATIKIGAGFRQLEPEMQRCTIVHELVHAHLHGAQDTVDNDLTAVLGRPAEAVLILAFNRQFEYGVDALAHAIAKHMPLINWPK